MGLYRGRRRHQICEAKANLLFLRRTKTNSMIQLIFSWLVLLSPNSSLGQDNCRNRLSYLHFDEMTPKERTLWLYCAFEKLKQGEDKHMKTYSAWSKKTPNYAEVMKKWKVIATEKTKD